MDVRLNRSWWLLRLGLGIGPIVAGIDKFFNFLTNWGMYLNPFAPRLLHIEPKTFMHLVGVVEIVVGVTVLTRLSWLSVKWRSGVLRCVGSAPSGRGFSRRGGLSSNDFLPSACSAREEPPALNIGSMSPPGYPL